MRRALLIGLSLLAGACGDATVPDETIPTVGYPSTGPYVSVAVDNHFHDVHPEDRVEISGDRPFVVRNEGSNLHNVTFPEADISEDVRPGKSFRIEELGETLGPGTHEFLCRYHADQGMTGEFTVVER